MYSCKSPSKYSSLCFLKEVQANHYMSEGGANYEAQEVDALIIEKECNIVIEEIWNEEDFADVIPFPTDSDMTTIEEDQLIPSSLLNELFNKVASAIRKVFVATKKAIKKKITISIERDLYDESGKFGNRSKLINSALRYYLDKVIGGPKI